MEHHPFLVPPVPRCGEPEACSVIAIRPWSFPSRVTSPAVCWTFPLNPMSGVILRVRALPPALDPFRYSERYDQGVMMWGENLFLLLGSETYFVCTQEQAFRLGCL
ncbi:hypothetical protein F2Q69_00058799 [Brassica cretica]|uniref:Uncharacterized protein n=1 Tax=Brassica cretica TaxID=69181 RepID=A0A8S9RDQ0_BRACR|nr:hypothetical protein F2Q69_00058799 [Brassica cretica]